MAERLMDENDIKELTVYLCEDFTRHWLETGERPTITQLIQLTIYLEALGVIYPQRLNLCPEFFAKEKANGSL